ncbi:MAG: substrate-binding domain-containing protein [Hyphomicrobiaceae bacterium]|nr:substrate-binding domain-containing protein [Hyphomicrobiaceae bacterium]
MKKLGPIVGIALCSTMLGGGVAVMSATPAWAQDDILIAVSMNRQQERRWAVDRAAMEAEAATLGVRLAFQYADSDPTKQASQVENLLSQNPQALIIVPADRNAAGAIVDSAHEAGVPVIAYDGGITTSKVDYYVTRNNYQVGELQVQAALDFAPTGNYAIVKGDAGNDVAQTIAKAYEDGLNSNGAINIVFDQFIPGWSPATAQSNAENVLSANNDDIAAFVVTNDGMATGVAQALISRDLQGKVFLSGLDGESASLKLVAEGIQTMTAYTDLEDHGRSAVAAAVALAKGEAPQYDTMMDLGSGEVPTHLVPIIAISKANVCDFVKNAPEGWTSVDEVFENPADCQ